MPLGDSFTNHPSEPPPMSTDFAPRPKHAHRQERAQRGMIGRKGDVRFAATGCWCRLSITGSVGNQCSKKPLRWIVI
jgi:hypothetical protein